MAAIMMCLLVALPLLGVTSALSLGSGINAMGRGPPPEIPPYWTSPNLGEDIHVIEISEAGYTRPFYSAAGSRNQLHLFSGASQIPIWSKNLDVGGLMIDDTTYGQRIEWNSVDISVDPVRVVAGLRNSTVTLHDESGVSAWSTHTRCGSGEVRAVAITPGADLVVAGSSSGKIEPGLDDWRMFHHDTKRTGQSPFDTTGNLGDTKWKYFIEESIWSSPSIGPDGTIYIGSYYSGDLYAVDSGGSPKVGNWPYVTGGTIQSSPAIGSNGIIYVGSGDGKLHAVNPDGSPVGGNWPYVIGGTVQSSPAIGSDGTIYVGSSDRKLYALKADGSLADGNWPYDAGSQIYSSPAIGSDGSVYFGTQGFRLHAVKPNGDMKEGNWPYVTGDVIWRGPAIGSDGTIYVGSYDNKLHAVKPNGDVKEGSWPYDAAYNIGSAPAISSDGTIYVGTQNGKLHAVKPDGTSKGGNWPYNAGSQSLSSPAIGSDDTIFFGSQDERVHAVSPDGVSRGGNWPYEGGGGWPGSSPAIGSDGTIYIGSHAGHLVAINSPKPYLCGFSGGGDLLFEGYVLDEYGYLVTDIDISESGKFITVSLAGDSAITVMYDYGDRQPIDKNEVIFEMPNPSKEVMPGDMVAYEFSIYNEIGITQLVTLTHDEPPEGWWAKFKFDGSSIWEDTVGVSLSPGESVDGNFFVGPPPDAQPDEVAEIRVYAEARGDPNFLPGIVDVLTTTTVSLTPAPPVPPTAHIDEIAPPTPVVDELVQFSGHGVAASGIAYFKWISSLDGVLIEGPIHSGFSTTSLSAGFHTIYFQVQDNEGVWSKFDTSWVVVRSGVAFPLGQKFFYENTDLNASIAEISEDGRVVAISSLYWHTVGTEKTSLCTYYTITNDWSSSDSWTYDFTDELEVTTISLSKLGSFIFVGTYTTSPAEAKVYVFYKEPDPGSVPVIIEDWTLDDLRIWSSDYDLYMFQSWYGYESGNLVLGTSGESTHTIYFYWWTDKRYWGGLGEAALGFYSSVGTDVAAVDISITDDAIDWHGAIFAGDRWDTTKHVYYWRLHYIWE